MPNPACSNASGIPKALTSARRTKASRAALVRVLCTLATSVPQATALSSSSSTAPQASAPRRCSSLKPAWRCSDPGQDIDLGGAVFGRAACGGGLGTSLGNSALDANGAATVARADATADAGRKAAALSPIVVPGAALWRATRPAWRRNRAATVLWAFNAERGLARGGSRMSRKSSKVMSSSDDRFNWSTI